MRVVLRNLAAVASGEVADHDRRAAWKLAVYVRGSVLNRTDEPGQTPILVALRPIAHEAFAAHRKLDRVGLYAMMGEADGTAERRSERRRCADTAESDDRRWEERAVPHDGTSRYFATVA